MFLHAQVADFVAFRESLEVVEVVLLSDHVEGDTKYLVRVVRSHRGEGLEDLLLDAPEERDLFADCLLLHVEDG